MSAYQGRSWYHRWWSIPRYRPRWLPGALPVTQADVRTRYQLLVWHLRLSADASFEPGARIRAAVGYLINSGRAGETMCPWCVGEPHSSRRRSRLGNYERQPPSIKGKEVNAGTGKTFYATGQSHSQPDVSRLHFLPWERLRQSRSLALTNLQARTVNFSTCKPEA